MGCLDEQTVVAFVSGALSGPRLAEVERHLLGAPTAPRWSRSPCRPARPITLDGRRSGAAAREAGRPPARSRSAHTSPAAVAVGRDRRALPAAEPGRPRRHGRGLRRARSRARSQGRDQDPARRHRPRRHRGRAAAARGAGAIAKLSHPNVVATCTTSAPRAGACSWRWSWSRARRWRRGSHQNAAHPREILRVFIMAGRGLAAAHRAGIIHRDFKPQNVMVGPRRQRRASWTSAWRRSAAAARTADAAPHARRVASSGRRSTCRPSSCAARPSIRAPTSSASASRSTRRCYGERPFAGDNFAELRAAVLDGQAAARRPREPRAPPAARPRCLRGLAVDRERRFPDMDALLDGARARSRAGAATTARAARGRDRRGLALTSGWPAALGWRARAAAPSPCAIPRPGWPPSGRRRPTPRAGAQIRAAFLGAADVRDARERFDRVSQVTRRLRDGWAAASRRGLRGRATPAGERRDLVACAPPASTARRAELGALADVLRARRRQGGPQRDRGAVDSLAASTVARTWPRCSAAPPARRSVAARAGRPAAGAAARAAGRRRRRARLAVAGADGALVEDVRAAGYEPLLAETLLVDARMRSPFDPEGAMPLYEEAYRARRGGPPSTSFAAEAAIQLIAIAADGPAPVRARASAGHGSPRRRWGARRIRAPAGLVLPQPRRVEGGPRASGGWPKETSPPRRSVRRAGARSRASGPGRRRWSSRSKAALVLGGAEAARSRSRIARSRSPAPSSPPSPTRWPPRCWRAGTALAALERAAEARADVHGGRGRRSSACWGATTRSSADPLTVLGEVALARGAAAPTRAACSSAPGSSGRRTSADGGARESRRRSAWRSAIWDVAPADRAHALELAGEARDGYAAIPDLAPRLASVDQWLEPATRRNRAHAPGRSP